MIPAPSGRQDSSGDFTRTWVPELAALPTRHLLAPWAAPPQVLRDAGVELGSSYPHRIVDTDMKANPRLPTPPVSSLLPGASSKRPGGTRRATLGSTTCATLWPERCRQSQLSGLKCLVTLHLFGSSSAAVAES